MEGVKAHCPSVSREREPSYAAPAYRFAFILLAAVVNGAAWWLFSLLACSFIGGVAGSEVPTAVGLIAAVASFIGLLAISGSQH